MNCDDNLCCRLYCVVLLRGVCSLHCLGCTFIWDCDSIIIILPVVTGLSCLPCIGKDQIKSVPSNKTSVSASRRFRFVPVLDNWCQKWDWRRDGTDDNEDDYGRQPCAPAKSWGGYVPHPVHWWRLNTAVDGVVGCQWLRCRCILYYDLYLLV